MARQLTRRTRRLRVHKRVRSKIRGTREAPRLCVFRSHRHIYAQLIDDDKGEVIAGVSTLKLEGKRPKHGGNVAAAKLAGQVIAKEALGKGVETVVFDRGGYISHGRVKALAEAAREAGLRI